MREVKVYFKYGQKGTGHYITDDSGDYDRELYIDGKWTYSIECIKYAFADLANAFDKEDGDCDYSTNILFITDEKDIILYDATNVDSYEALEYSKKVLLDRASCWTD